MQDSIRHVEERLGGPNPTGASTKSSHPTHPSASSHPYGDRKMYPPTNPSSSSDPNANSGKPMYASANDPSYGKMGSGFVPRNAGGNPASGAFSVNTKKAHVESSSEGEAGMGSVDRLDTGGPWGRETLEDYGYSEAGLEAGHGSPLGINKAAAQGPMGRPMGSGMGSMSTSQVEQHRFGEAHRSVHPGARARSEPGAEAMTVEALRARRERDFEGGVSGMGGRKGSVRLD